MGPTYEVWHFDGKRPEILSTGHPDKGVCRRVWRNSTHAAIVRDGVVLEPKSTCGGRQARAIASAAAEAHREATGQASEMAPRGVPGGDGKRLLESSAPALRALDERPVEPMPAKYAPAPVEEVPPVEVAALPEALTPADEAPAPVVVVTRKPVPLTTETPMPSTTTGRCPCGEPSAPTADRGGRPSTPEFRDLCATHRNRALGRRRRTGEGPRSARAWALGEDAPAAGPVASKPAASKPRPSKKPAPAARLSKPIAAEAPVSDLLAAVRRQRAIVDALGGPDQAERVAAAAARVGGPEALVHLVDELAGAVA